MNQQSKKIKSKYTFLRYINTYHVNDIETQQGKAIISMEREG